MVSLKVAHGGTGEKLVRPVSANCFQLHFSRTVYWAIQRLEILLGSSCDEQILRNTQSIVGLSEHILACECSALVKAIAIPGPLSPRLSGCLVLHRLLMCVHHIYCCLLQSAHTAVLPRMVYVYCTCISCHTQLPFKGLRKVVMNLTLLLFSLSQSHQSSGNYSDTYQIIIMLQLKAFFFFFFEIWRNERTHPANVL